MCPAGCKKHKDVQWFSLNLSMDPRFPIECLLEASVSLAMADTRNVHLQIVSKFSDKTLEIDFFLAMASGRKVCFTNHFLWVAYGFRGGVSWPFTAECHLNTCPFRVI